MLAILKILVKNEDFHRSGKIPDFLNEEVPIPGIRMNAHSFKIWEKFNQG